MSLQIILKNSSVSGKEPTASQLANGELALNYHADGPFISCKDTAGVVRRIAGVWIGTTAPSSPQPGEFWLDTNTDPAKLKVYKDSTDTWIDTITVVAASTTEAGIVELATNAETQTGTDTLRAVTPASLQSKVSDSTNTTSSTTIASSTAVKSAKDVADAALPAAGGTISGNLIVSGDLTVNGTTTTIDTETLEVKDKNIEMGVVSTPTDTTADGGGITLKGATDKTINWVNATDAWTSSERFDFPAGTAAAPSIILNGDVNSGIYQLGADQVAISTGGTGRLFVDGSGKVGINDSSPAGKLHVQGSTGAPSLTYDTADVVNLDAGTIQLAIGINSSSPFGAYLQGRATNNTSRVISLNPAGGDVGVGTASPAVALHVAKTGTPQFRLEDLDTANAYSNVSASNGNFVIQADPQNVSGATRIGFEIDGSEAMRIDSDQIIYTTSAIGQTFYASNNTDLRTQTGGAVDTGAVGIESTADNTGNRFHISFSNPNGVVGSIRTNASATAFLTSSDYRLKENVTPVTDGIDRLKQLKPSRFNFITDPSVTVDGFLAHEVQGVIPEAISGEKDAVQTWEEGEKLPEGVSVGDTKLDENGDPRPAYQGIDQSKLVPLLTAALQEAIAKIETLEARLNATGL